MFEHVFKKFAFDEARIRAHASKSAELCAILNDYEEICTYIAAQTGGGKAGAAELCVARETAHALEEEIKEFLAAH